MKQYLFPVGASSGYRHPLYCAFFSVLVICFNATNSVAQKSRFWNKDMEKIAQPSSKEGWIDFRHDFNVDPNSLFVDYKSAFGLRQQDEMHLVKSKTDKYGFTHRTYNQYYKGIRVSGKQFKVHTDEEQKAVSANGKIAREIDLQITPALSENSALQAILQSIDVSTGLWNNKAEEQRLKTETKDQNASYYPKGELVVFQIKSKQAQGDTFVLAWKFDIHLSLPHISHTYFIDANNGETLNSYPLTLSCDPGTVNTPWYGNRSISISPVGGGFRLLDDCTGSHPYNIRTRWQNADGDLADIVSGNADYNNGQLEIGGGTAHWAVHQACVIMPT
ncbi:MAG: hypothetical protein H7246_11535 [Phycisphaerae bacterium]|nr:hypothetical protein [Saprospiraceae bacterium]